jgi:hypothetical protein
MKRGWRLLAVWLLVASCATTRPPAGLADQVRLARTAEDYRAVAARYHEYSARLRDDAAQHVKLAEWWSDPAGPWDAGEGRHVRTAEAFRVQEARHCRSLADSLDRAAREAQAIAEVFERAGSGR